MKCILKISLRSLSKAGCEKLARGREICKARRGRKGEIEEEKEGRGGGRGAVTTTGRLENARTCARVFSRGMPRGAAA